MSAIVGSYSNAVATGPSYSPRVLTLLRAAAILTVLLISSRVFVGMGVTLGHLASLALLPLWITAFRRYAWGNAVLWLGLLATVASVWLTVAASTDHETTATNLVANTMLMTGSVAGIGVLLWARAFLPLWVLGSAYGFGMLASALARPAGFEDNPWKFAIAVPLAILVLSLVERLGRKWLEVAALLVFAGASAALDSRSYFAEFLIAAMLVGWQLLPRRAGKRTTAVRAVALFGLIALAVYHVGSSLLVQGVLGAEAQERSVEQVNRAGSVIVGGRPELAATIALFLFRPLGYGAGTLATTNDINVAKSGMQAINYDPNNGYVENFMFGQKFELHSMLGDFWAYAGFAGIAFGVAAIAALLLVLGRSIAVRGANAVVIFVVVQSLWNFLFNPLYSSAPVLVLALGLGLALTARAQSMGPADRTTADAADGPDVSRPVPA